MILSDHFKAEDMIRLNNEFHHGLLELDLTPRQNKWLGGILNDYARNGMSTKCTPESVKFLENMMDGTIFNAAKFMFNRKVPLAVAVRTLLHPSQRRDSDLK